ncbi:MAG: hypothetical protein ABI216_08120 [Devosia sp.]
MSVTSRRQLAVKSFDLAAVAVGAVFATLLTSPQAFAGPPDDLFASVNAAHVAAGCPAYGVANQLGDLAVQFAKSMALNNGRTQTTAFHVNTDQLLSQAGYLPSAWGEMDYFNPNGSGSAQDASAFWQSQGTKALIANCGVTQLGIGVWIVGNNWAASAILGTPGTAPAPDTAPPLVVHKPPPLVDDNTADVPQAGATPTAAQATTIYDAPGGNDVAYLDAGDGVTIVKCNSDGWCKISAPKEGYVWGADLTQ